MFALFFTFFCLVIFPLILAWIDNKTDYIYANILPMVHILSLLGLFIYFCFTT